MFLGEGIPQWKRDSFLDPCRREEPYNLIGDQSNEEKMIYCTLIIDNELIEYVRWDSESPFGLLSEKQQVNKLLEREKSLEALAGKKVICYAPSIHPKHSVLRGFTYIPEFATVFRGEVD